MIKRLLLCITFCVLGASASAGDDINITIGYLERVIPPPPTLSNLDPIPENEGLSGTRLGILDNATTGKFLQHGYTLEAVLVGEEEDWNEAALGLLQKTSLIIVNAPATDVLALADLPEAKGAILFNSAARERSLRGDECRANVLHTIPSRAMLADALAQFAVLRRWTDWVLIEGPHDEDKALANALEDSATKFRLEIKAKKGWAFDADMRRNAAQEVPLFTQDFPDYDLLVVADEANDFARYLSYHTWLPRPVAGSTGLRPVIWSRAVEQHGAAQLQSRFIDAEGRDMRPVDYGAWAATRVIGEAVTRTNSSDVQTLRNYILSDAFELAGFKGRKMTFRKWNGQLRQPIPLAHADAVAALAPVDGFLHQNNELDTLGQDQPESTCTVFGG